MELLHKLNSNRTLSLEKSSQLERLQKSFNARLDNFRIVIGGLTVPPQSDMESVRQTQALREKKELSLAILKRYLTQYEILNDSLNNVFVGWMNEIMDSLYQEESQLQ
jgi:hypothetical protein